MGQLHKEQLMHERQFIDFCTRDEFSSPKIDRPITKEFLDACEKDGLVMPLLKEKEVVKGDDGQEKSVDVRYYSPFQIYQVGVLAKNEIGEDGLLRDPSFAVYGTEHNTRYISWGHGAFNVDAYRKKNEEDMDYKHEVNYFHLFENLHQFLRLIHGLDSMRHSPFRDGNRGRYFTAAPSLEYDLDPVRKEKEAYLQQYHLSIEKLKRLVTNAGHYATATDPLEHWFHYLKRHPQWRKDQLKGPAALVQDVYGLCDIIYDVIEATSGEKLPPLPNFIHPDIQPYMVERPEYAQGADIKAIIAAHKKLSDWVQGHTGLLSEIAPLSAEGKQIQATIEEHLSKTRQELADYEKRYGDRRYVGSMRIFKPDEPIELAGLDEQTRKWVTIMMAQHKSVEIQDGQKVFTTSFDDIMDDYRKNKITLEEAERRDRAMEEKYEITRAIERRLDDLGRDVLTVAGQIANATWPLHYKAEREKEMATPQAWDAFNKSAKPDAPDYAARRAKFWQKELKEFQKPYDDKIKEVDHARKELYGIGNEARLVFCADCREKTVLLHHGHNDQQVSSEAVCDDCFGKVSDNALGASKGEWNQIKYGEWKCDCGKLLYKFALGNVVGLRTEGGVPIKVELPYGRTVLEAKCTNKECGQVSRRVIDWGWQP